MRRRTEPYLVQLYPDWTPGNGTTVGFQDEAEARRFASLRPEPIIDLCRRGDGVIASRRAIPHPLLPVEIFALRDDFPDTRP